MITKTKKKKIEKLKLRLKIETDNLTETEKNIHNLNRTGSVGMLTPAKMSTLINQTAAIYRRPLAEHKLTVTNCSHVCAYHYAPLLYTIKQRTVLTIFPLIFQTVIIAQMQSTDDR